MKFPTHFLRPPPASSPDAARKQKNDLHCEDHEETESNDPVEFSGPLHLFLGRLSGCPIYCNVAWYTEIIIDRFGDIFLLTMPFNPVGS